MEGNKESLHTENMADGDPKLGSVLAEARTRIRPKVSQARVGQLVAKRLGLPRPITGAAVGQWENGRTKPTTDGLIAVCQILQIDLKAATEGKLVSLGEGILDVENPRVQEFTIASEVLPPRAQMPQDIEVRGTAEGGPDGVFHFNGETVDRVRRPPALANKKRVYAIYVSGHSMEPRFENGELVYVDADRPASIGDYVVIQLGAPGDETGAAYLKRLVRRTAEKIICEQFNPPKELTFSTKKVAKLHRVMPWNEVLGI